MESPEKTNERAERRRGHIPARRLGVRVARTAWWREFARAPSRASGRARKYRHAPCRLRMCGGSGGGWVGGAYSGGDDSITASAVPPGVLEGPGQRPSKEQNGKGSWCVAF